MNTFFLYILYTIYYYTIYIYIVTTYYLTIYILLNQSLTKVVIYFFVVTTTYYFFTSKIMLHRCFCIFFQCFLSKNRKKSANFLQFFLVVYQLVRRKLKKKLLETLDKILKCCIFASC